MTILERCKKALRISHTSLDDVITQDIATARLEMRRVGISDTIANSNNELIQMAILPYVLMIEGNPDKYEQYKEAWNVQVDMIRKSGELPANEDDERPSDTENIE